MRSLFYPVEASVFRPAWVPAGFCAEPERDGADYFPSRPRRQTPGLLAGFPASRRGLLLRGCVQLPGLFLLRAEEKEFTN